MRDALSTIGRSSRMPERLRVEQEINLKSRHPELPSCDFIGQNGDSSIPCIGFTMTYRWRYAYFAGWLTLS